MTTKTTKQQSEKTISISELLYWSTPNIKGVINFIAALSEIKDFDVQMTADENAGPLMKKAELLRTNLQKAFGPEIKQTNIEGMKKLNEPANFKFIQMKLTDEQLRSFKPNALTFAALKLIRK